MTGDSLVGGPILSDEDFKKLIALGESMAATAGSGQPGKKLAAEPSYIPVQAKPPVTDAGILAVDVGGTHIKIGLRTVSKTGQTTWKELLDIDNSALNTGSDEGKCLERMTHELCKHIVAKLDHAGIEKSTIAGIGVVWSNQLTNAPITDKKLGIKGVTGMVSGSRSGTAYRKGEWWNKDIDDGDNVGAMFIDAFRDLGFQPRSFVIGNDTIFTAKAIDNADSGMVASTGANATIIPAGQNMLCNSESGGNFSLSTDVIGLPEVSGIETLKLEDVMAGKNMPLLFAEYIIQAAQNGSAELKPVAESIMLARKSGKAPFAAQCISLILQGKFDEFLNGKDSSSYSDGARSSLVAIAEKLIENAGKFAAAMAWFSICNQLPEKKHFVIALDSSQARFQAGYLSTMKKAMNELLAAKGKTGDVKLLEPAGEISVPMMGVARAANDFL